MPIIINEIEVSVDVTGTNAAAAPAGTPPAGLNKEEIVRECVERVMEILAQKKER